MRGFEIIGKGNPFAVGLSRANRFEFVATLSDELIFVEGRRGVGSGIRCHGIN
jgi:hypothetical protein